MMNPFPLKYKSEIEIQDYNVFYKSLLDLTDGKHAGIKRKQRKYELVGNADSFYLMRINTNLIFGPYLFCSYDNGRKLLSVKIGYSKFLCGFMLLLVTCAVVSFFNKGLNISLYVFFGTLIFFYLGTLILYSFEFERLKKIATNMSNYFGAK